MAAAEGRLRIAREERDQFEEANNQMVEHLKAKVIFFLTYLIVFINSIHNYFQDLFYLHSFYH